MSKLTLVVIFILVQFINFTTTYSETFDKIVAVVNDEVITQSEIDEALKPVYTQYKSTYSKEELIQKLNQAREDILNQLIEEKLILQQAKKEEIEVSDEEIEEKLTQVKSQFPDEDTFRQVLDSQNLTISDLKQRYKEQIMIKKLINKEVRAKIKVSPLEVFRYYKQHQEEFRIPPKVRVQTILIRKDDKMSEDYSDPQKRIEEIKKKLQEGADFSKLAREYSQDSSAINGGDMGYIEKGEMMKEIDEVLFSLNEGQVSDIIETHVGFHIFKINDKKESTIKSFEEVRVEIENMLFQKKAEVRYTEWLKTLKENAYISIK